MRLLVALDKMVDHDAACHERRWRAADHECELCGDDVAGTQMARLTCGHSYCRGCIAEMVKLHVTAGQVRCVAPPNRARAPAHMYACGFVRAS